MQGVLNSEFFSFNNIGTWLGVLLGVVAIIYAISTKREKSPNCAIKSFNLFKNFASTITSLAITYDGKKVENLTVTKIAFWNSGKETIKKDDIASLDPLRIEVKPSIEILDEKIIHLVNPANNFSLKREADQSKLFLNFEYIDQGDGVVIQVLHTGLSSEDVLFKGAIKGVGKLKINEITTTPLIYQKGENKKREQFITFYLASMVGLILGCGSQDLRLQRASRFPD